jgi:hypothetical protein
MYNIRLFRNITMNPPYNEYYLIKKSQTIYFKNHMEIPVFLSILKVAKLFWKN